jgi:hypothetical protein
MAESNNKFDTKSYVRLSSGNRESSLALQMSQATEVSVLTTQYNCYINVLAVVLTGTQKRYLGPFNSRITWV